MALLLIVVKASVVLLSALGAAALLGHSAASTRHRLWSVAFALLLAVPALAFVMPALNVPMPVMHPQAITMKGSEGQSSVSSLETLATPATVNVSSPSQNLSQTKTVQSPSLTFMAEMVWLMGFVAALGTLCLSLFRVGRLSRDSDELMDAGWQSSASAISARLGLSPAPRLVASERMLSPMAGGLLRPTVFLPASARTWDAERRDVVLTHEIAHLASRDPLRHLIARLAVACYWFHPLAWLAAHRATASREQACDEAVLAAGTRPSAYARVLLELAEAAGSGAPLTALPMAQRSNLEKRLMTILKNDAQTSTSSGWLVAAVALTAVTLSVAAARPSAAVVDAVVENVGALPPAAASEAPAPQRVAESRSFAGGTDACRWNDEGSFSGSTNNNRSGVTMRVGRTDSQTIVQRSFDGLRVCMVADGLSDRVDRPAQMLDRASRVSISSERDGQTQQMDIVRTGGSAKTTWRVNGKERPVDAAAEEWRRSMLALLDNTWEASQIQGEVSTLQGQISTIHGEESTLRGEISTLQGHVSSLQGEISTVRGRESTLRGEISSIEGRLSSLQGEISSEQGAISSLNARRYDTNATESKSIDARISSHRHRIDEIRKEIEAYDADGKRREVEKVLDKYNADEQAREIQKQLDAFNVTAKVRDVEKEITGLQVDAKVREIEKQIVALNADTRVNALQSQQADLLNRLRAAIAAIR